ncbi:hypothetical protein [Nocardia sp. NPDC003963]
MAIPGPTSTRIRGVFVGSAVGAVSIAAHAFGGGTFAAGSAAIALLLAGCAIAGALATVARPGGPIALMASLALGQAFGHTALAAAPGHEHGGSSTAPMLSAHLVAIPVGALLIRIAERAIRYAVSRLTIALRQPICHELPTPRPVVAPEAERGPHRLLLLASGPGTRGPPLRHI